MALFGSSKVIRANSRGCKSVPFPCGDHPSCALQKAMLQTDPLRALTFEREWAKAKREHRKLWKMGWYVESGSVDGRKWERRLTPYELSQQWQNLSITQHENSTFFPEALIMAISKENKCRSAWSTESKEHVNAVITLALTTAASLPLTS